MAGAGVLSAMACRQLMSTVDNEGRWWKIPFVNPFRLARDEVEVSASSGSSGRTSVRQPRKLGLSSWEFTLTHAPTGLQVSGEVPKGHYSKAQLSSLKDDLLKKLWHQLERNVAARLRIPGR